MRETCSIFLNVDLKAKEFMTFLNTIHFANFSYNLSSDCLVLSNIPCLAKSLQLHSFGGLPPLRLLFVIHFTALYRLLVQHTKISVIKYRAVVKIIICNQNIGDFKIFYIAIKDGWYCNGI